MSRMIQKYVVTRLLNSNDNLSPAHAAHELALPLGGPRGMTSEPVKRPRFRGGSDP
jgi:hypothetical protein